MIIILNLISENIYITNLDIMEFVDKKKVQLSEYKTSILKDKVNGEWHGSKYEYILEESSKMNNIIEAYRSDFLGSTISKKIKLHEGFTHLNSSQAMCINFFYPLYKEKQLELILKYLGLEGEKVNYRSVVFEKLSNIDNGCGESTNFDFYMETKSKKKIFFEIKYTESGFGKVACDDCHINKYNKVYKDKLFVIKEEHRDVKIFLNNYQLMRNLIQIGKNEDKVVFLFPEDNIRVANQANFAKYSLVDTKYAKCLEIIFWKDIYTFVEDNLSSTKLKDFYKEFAAKYL